MALATYVSSVSVAAQLPRATSIKRLVRTHGAKGFGKQTQPTKTSKQTNKTIGDAKIPDKALRDALSSVTRIDELLARPIDPNEATRGQLDTVQVKHWGSGDPSQLGELQVQAVSTQYAAGQAPPLAELLARELQLAQARGALAISGPPPPPFERWRFTAQRYLRYLAGLREVHAAMERALEEMGPAAAAAGAAAGVTALQQLARSPAVAADMAALQLHHQQHTAVSPSQTARAHADYIRQLSRSLSSSSSSSSSSAPPAAFCKLLAHAYALYVSLLTTGGRIGGAAAEALQLLPAAALATYRSFPPAAGDPLQCFVAGVNGIGGQLTSGQVDVVVEELPKAFTKTSLLLDVLARCD